MPLRHKSSNATVRAPCLPSRKRPARRAGGLEALVEGLHRSAEKAHATFQVASAGPRKIPGAPSPLECPKLPQEPARASGHKGTRTRPRCLRSPVPTGPRNPQEAGRPRSAPPSAHSHARQRRRGAKRSRDCYARLGVPRDATEADVRRAFHEQATPLGSLDRIGGLLPPRRRAIVLTRWGQWEAAMLQQQAALGCTSREVSPLSLVGVTWCRHPSESGLRLQPLLALAFEATRCCTRVFCDIALLLVGRVIAN